MQYQGNEHTEWFLGTAEEKWTKKEEQMLLPALSNSNVYFMNIFILFNSKLIWL